MVVGGQNVLLDLNYVVQARSLPVNFLQVLSYDPNSLLVTSVYANTPGLFSCKIILT
jgi:hypothetical protein